MKKVFFFIFDEIVNCWNGIDSNLSSAGVCFSFIRFLEKFRCNPSSDCWHFHCKCKAWFCIRFGMKSIISCTINVSIELLSFRSIIVIQTQIASIELLYFYFIFIALQLVIKLIERTFLWPNFFICFVFFFGFIFGALPFIQCTTICCFSDFNSMAENWSHLNRTLLFVGT